MHLLLQFLSIKKARRWGEYLGERYLAANAVESIGVEEPTMDAKYGPISELVLLLQMRLND